MDRKLEVPPGTVPLAAACAELKLSWTQGFRLVLIGALAGRQVRGRWYVEARSLRTMVERAARGESVLMDRRRLPRPRDARGRYVATARINEKASTQAAG